MDINLAKVFQRNVWYEVLPEVEAGFLNLTDHTDIICNTRTSSSMGNSIIGYLSRRPLYQLVGNTPPVIRERVFEMQKV